MRHISVKCEFSRIFDWCSRICDRSSTVDLNLFALIFGRYSLQVDNKTFNHKNFNFIESDWFKKLLVSTNSLAKFLSDSLVLDSLLLDSLLTDSSISQSHSKL